ncbi:MAG: hypothetical protein AAFR61_00615 [Bacteroidota bacterium]
MVKNGELTVICLLLSLIRLADLFFQEKHLPEWILQFQKNRIQRLFLKNRVLGLREDRAAGDMLLPNQASFFMREGWLSGLLFCDLDGLLSDVFI